MQIMVLSCHFDKELKTIKITHRYTQGKSELMITTLRSDGIHIRKQLSSHSAWYNDSYEP